MPEGISPAARIGAVALNVSDLDRSVQFYQDHLGLRLISREDGTAVLGAGENPIVRLYEVPGARKPRNTTGLYHFAILFPTRLELAQALRQLAINNAPIEGAADHGVSEAIYLHDPDGNGIEIYRDRPREEWPRDESGKVDMGTDPLDIDNLLEELEKNPEPWPGADPATRVGHVHLHVANLARAEVFYTGVVGLALMQRYGSAAAFLSAGGYHHHVGVNTWAGPGAQPPPPGSAGLRYFEILLPDQAELEREAAQIRGAGVTVEERPEGLFFTDPSQNGIVIKKERD